MTAITLIALLLATFILTMVINIAVSMLLGSFLSENISFAISLPFGFMVSCWLLRSTWQLVGQNLGIIRKGNGSKDQNERAD